MAICDKCKEKIKYNKFKRYRRKILCLECYKHRNDKIEEIITPTEGAKKEAEKLGIDLNATLNEKKEEE